MADQPRKNGPCPCGSGKKSKQCCRGRKPRHHDWCLQFPPDLPGPTQIVLSPDGTVSFRRDAEHIVPTNGTAEMAYDRERKGRKVLSRIPLDPKEMYTDPNLALTTFDTLYAVDTNTKRMGNNRVSVGCAAQVKLNKANGGVEFSVSHDLAIELWNLQGNPEAAMWQYVLETAASSPFFRQSKSLALVVDSELGRINDFNTQSRPIVNDFWLPDRWHVIYASADKPNECVANSLIALCDRLATRILDCILQKGVPSQFQEHEVFGFGRIWMPELSDGAEVSALGASSLANVAKYITYREYCPIGAGTLTVDTLSSTAVWRSTLRTNPPG